MLSKIMFVCNFCLVCIVLAITWRNFTTILKYLHLVGAMAPPGLPIEPSLLKVKATVVSEKSRKLACFKVTYVVCDSVYSKYISYRLTLSNVMRKKFGEI